MAVKTPVYLSDALRWAPEVEAAVSGRSEAEMIREAIAETVAESPLVMSLCVTATVDCVLTPDRRHLEVVRTTSGGALVIVT